ncbi:MAG: hypothetical protein LBC02_13035 [Planctomycetaceae bacterium]|nr:hypothetical protein [Planctomycetaceae bacterium]
MKTFFSQLVLVAVIFISVISISYGDLERPDYNVTNVSLETLQINDSTGDRNGGEINPLYRIFNEYFHDELVALGQSNYTSGNELANDRMIRQTISSWQVNEGSNVVASFTSSAVAHGFQIFNPVGNQIFDSEIYASTTDGQAIMRNQEIALAAGNYVFSVFSDFESSPFAINGKPRDFSGDHDWYYETDEYQNNWAPYYDDGIQHFISIDVTDLMRQRVGYENIESAFLFAFEDLTASASDFDYQDFAFILTNVSANVAPPAATPEPATALILGFVGSLALPFLRRKKKTT